MASLTQINRFIVLMLENRSFDHLFGYLNSLDPRVAGLTGNESNKRDPNSPADAAVPVSPASSFLMTFDPAHEYYDVQVQLFGPMANTDPGLPPVANLPRDPAPMSGFVASALSIVDFLGDEERVMECFSPEQLPVLSTLAREFGLFNFWYSSLPGPTWPNRFFVHAATSGGLTDSPSLSQILGGFSFQNGTIYERLEDGGRSWCIYHDGLPQTAGIPSLRAEFLNPLTENFGSTEEFFEDLRKGELPDYSFVEPRYDTGNNYLDGNSMHPLNDIRHGERLVKRIYEALRKSPCWSDTMLIITFDEHGGFYDHQSPPEAIPPGDAPKYANPAYDFRFDRLGVRVPALAISAFTARGTIVGSSPDDPVTVFDHSSVLATVEQRFGLAPLTQRDRHANTLAVAINLDQPRISSEAAPLLLPQPAADALALRPIDPSKVPAAAPKAPLSSNQKTMAALALACDMEITAPENHAALLSNQQKLVEQADAAAYIQKVETKLMERRQAVP